MKIVIRSLILVLGLSIAGGVAAAKEADKATPKLMERAATPDAKPARAAPKRAVKARDLNRLMTQHIRSGKPIPGASPTQVKAAGAIPPPQKYEIEDCGEGLVCCSYSGENSTCNLFMYICSQNGGSPMGDPNEATCKF